MTRLMLRIVVRLLRAEFLVVRLRRRVWMVLIILC